MEGRKRGEGTGSYTANAAQTSLPPNKNFAFNSAN